MKTYYIKTFGCQMNKSDSERLSGIMAGTGMNLSETIDDADVVIFNTCCVRENAENKFYGHLYNINNKNKNNKLVIAAGCLAQREKENLLRKGADIVIGPQSIGDLPGLIDKKKITLIREELNVFSADLPEKRESKFNSWLPIITGCNNFCSYCAVPYVRGREKSLPFEKAVNATKKAVSDNAAEITLLGQNVNSYGTDIYGKPKFAKLLKEISKIDGLNRIRFATSHPKDLDDKVIDIIASNKNICSHVHLPVQSGSTSILKAMGRGYEKEDYINLADKIRNKIPGVSLTTDIMIGFPGETDEDFQDTLDVVHLCKFDGAYTFIYSPRPGTKAYPLKEVEKKVKSKRFGVLTEVIQNYCQRGNEKLIGKTVEVLIEGPSKNNDKTVTARTDCNRIVHIDNSKEIKAGQIRIVKISESFLWYLKGDIDG